MDAISRLMKIQARSLPGLGNVNVGTWEAERDATLELEFTSRVNVQQVTEADWLVRKVTSDTQKRRTFGHYFRLTGNRNPLIHFSFERHCDERIRGFSGTKSSDV
jgi:hypothetical protein